MQPSLTLLLRRLVHYAFYAAGGVVIVMCLVALALKFWLMPDVDRFRPDLEAAVSREVGVPVRIGTLAADWQGIHPRLTLRDVRLIPAEGEPLVLPEVEAIGSWWSVVLLEPRLARINVDEPSLPLRRTPDGIIHLAGIPINGPGAPSPFPDWLLRQPRIVIKDARITWLDQMRGAPPLQISRVRLLVENRFGRHRFGGVARPSATATRLDLRGDFKGHSVHAPQSWSGTLFAQVSQARFERWGQWVPWAQESVKSGEGDLRFWLNVEDGQVRGLTGDAHLHKLAVSVSKHLPDLRFESLMGRIGWTRGDHEGPSHSFFVDKLRFQAPDAAPAEPANLRLTLTPDGRGGFSRIETEAANLRLEALTALSGALPLPSRGHDLITALAPRGLVESARGHWAGPQDYAFHANLREGGLQAYEAFPGLAGLNLKVEATHKGGKATLGGSGFLLDWPGIFRHQLEFTQLDAETDWQFEDQGLRISFEAKRLANADLEGTAKGAIQLPRTSPPIVDISARLSRGEAKAVHRYLPHAIAQDAYDWLRHSLTAGHTDDARLTLKGDLGHFPFDRGGGEFRVSVRMVDGGLDYSDGWPPIRGVHGLLVFHDKAMTLTADKGRILEAQLGPVKVVIPDLYHTADEIAWVEGVARGATHTFLDFVRQSPVDRYTNHFLRPFDSQGMGVLSLKLALPLGHLDDTTVGGAYTFHSNTLSAPPMRELSQVNGSITFTEKSVKARGVQLRLLEMPAQLDLESQEGGELSLRLTGTASADTLRPLLPPMAANRMLGTAQWQVALDLGDDSQVAGLTLNSDLVGMAIGLPPPFGKTATQALPLNVVYQPGKGGMNRVSARYGTLARLQALMPPAGNARLNLHLGTGETTEPTEPGLWITGNLRFLDLDAWRSHDWGREGEGKGAPEESGPILRQASLNLSELQVFNRRLHDTHLRLQPSGKGWNLKVAGKEVTGEVTTVPEQKGHRVMAQFKRFAVPDAERTGKSAAPVSAGETPRLTDLDLSIQSLAWNNYELGELRLRLTPVKTGFQVEHFLLSPAEGKLEGSGLVSDHPRRPTRLNLKLTARNLGKLLGRLGHADAVKGGETELSGSLGWVGGPQDFNFNTLEGDLDLSIRKGQFLKVDPGAGRLVGVLNLQSLPRRISLDFRDVFSQGFAFDEIAGRIHMEQGSAYMQDLRMSGPAAKISMSGVVNLAAETQNLKLRIQPHLEESAAVAGALLGGPAVGLGALLANKVLKNPLGQAMEFEYAVSGNWADPVIAKVPRKSARIEQETQEGLASTP